MVVLSLSFWLTASRRRRSFAMKKRHAASGSDVSMLLHFATSSRVLIHKNDQHSQIGRSACGRRHARVYLLFLFDGISERKKPKRHVVLVAASKKKRPMKKTRVGNRARRELIPGVFKRRLAFQGPLCCERYPSQGVDCQKQKRNVPRRGAEKGRSKKKNHSTTAKEKKEPATDAVPLLF